MWSSFPKTEPGALLEQWKPVAVLSLSLPSGLAVGDTVTQFGLSAQNKAATPLLIDTLLSSQTCCWGVYSWGEQKVEHWELLQDCDNYMFIKEQTLWSWFWEEQMILLSLCPLRKRDSLQELLGGTILHLLDSQVQRWLEVLSCWWHCSTRNLTHLYFALLYPISFLLELTVLKSLQWMPRPRERSGVFWQCSFLLSCCKISRPSGLSVGRKNIQDLQLVSL